MSCKVWVPQLDVFKELMVGWYPECVEWDGYPLPDCATTRARFDNENYDEYKNQK